MIYSNVDDIQNPIWSVGAWLCDPPLPTEETGEQNWGADTM